jgi:hypothetical protein
MRKRYTESVNLREKLSGFHYEDFDFFAPNVLALTKSGLAQHGQIARGTAEIIQMFKSLNLEKHDKVWRHA